MFPDYVFGLQMSEAEALTPCFGCLDLFWEKRMSQAQQKDVTVTGMARECHKSSRNKSQTRKEDVGLIVS